MSSSMHVSFGGVSVDVELSSPELLQRLRQVWNERCLPVLATQSYRHGKAVPAPSKPIELLAVLLGGANAAAEYRRQDASAPAGDAVYAAQRELLAAIEAQCGGPLGLYATVAASQPEQRGAILAAVHTARRQIMGDGPAAALPAVFAGVGGDASTPSPYAFSVQFGGQGVDYLTELRHCTSAHPTTVAPFVQRVTAMLEKQAASEEAAALGLHTYGFDVVSWLLAEHDEDIPPQSYLRAAHISYPLIGLTQLANWMSLGVASVGVGGLRALVATSGGCSIGHSQGVMSAMAISCSGDSAESFEAVATKAVLTLFWQGLRLEAGSRRFAEHQHQRGVRVPSGATPMLSVRGLTPEALAKVVAKANAVNAHKREAASQTLESLVSTVSLLDPLEASMYDMQVSLVNDATKCVVTGPPTALSELRTFLTKKYAEVSDEQSRVPHSKRVARVGTLFLNVSACFHHTGNQKAANAIAADMERLNITWKRSEMSFPVLSTLDGSDLATGAMAGATDDNITEYLIGLQATAVVNWHSVCASMDTLAAGKDAESAILCMGPGGGGNAALLTSTLVAGGGTRLLLAAPASIGGTVSSACVLAPPVLVLLPRRRRANAPSCWTPRRASSPSPSPFSLASCVSRLTPPPPAPPFAPHSPPLAPSTRTQLLDHHLKPLQLVLCGAPGERAGLGKGLRAEGGAAQVRRRASPGHALLALARQAADPHRRHDAHDLLQRRRAGRGGQQRGLPRRARGGRSAAEEHLPRKGGRARGDPRPACGYPRQPSLLEPEAVGVPVPALHADARGGCAD
jgi:malonyl CoA-acyl carrier protein transacylase